MFLTKLLVAGNLVQIRSCLVPCQLYVWPSQGYQHTFNSFLGFCLLLLSTFLEGQEILTNYYENLGEVKFLGNMEMYLLFKWPQEFSRPEYVYVYGPKYFFNQVKLFCFCHPTTYNYYYEELPGEKSYLLYPEKKFC